MEETSKKETATIYYNNDRQFEWRYIQIGEQFYSKHVDDGETVPAGKTVPIGIVDNSFSKKTTINIEYDPAKEIDVALLVVAANRKMAWLKAQAKEHASPFEGPPTEPKTPLLSDSDDSDDETKSAEEESAARIPAPISSAVSHTDTGYHIIPWLIKCEKNLKFYIEEKMALGYALRDDYKGFKKEIRGLPHNVKVHDNGGFESDYVHADSPLAASISANVFILALRTYSVIYAKSGKSDASLPAGEIIFRLNPRDLDPRHLRVYDEFSEDVQKKVMTWIKSHPKEYPPELISKFKFIRPDGTKIDLNPNATPTSTAKKSDELTIRKKVKPTSAPAVDSSSSDDEKSSPPSPRSRSGSGSF